MKKPKCNAVFNPLRKEGARHENQRRDGRFSRRHKRAPYRSADNGAPQHDASRGRPPLRRAARPPAAQSFVRRAGPRAHKLRRGVKFILWIAARNDRISVANVT